MRPIRIAAAALFAAVLPACSTAQLRMPEDFGTDASAHEVSGHSPRRFNEPVRFGPYSALEMREGSTFSWSLPVAALDVGRTSKPYAYTLVARGLPPVEVQCLSRAWTVGYGDESQRTTADLTALAGPLLACGLRLDGQPAQSLEVAREGRHMQGRLQAPWGGQYAVHSLNAYQGTPITSTTPTGYAITDAAGTTVAVVDVLNRGRVHLGNGLNDDERVYLAATAAALLLLDPTLGE